MLHFSDQIKRLRILSLKFIEVASGKGCDIRGDEAMVNVDCSIDVQIMLIAPLTRAAVLEPEDAGRGIRWDVLGYNYSGYFTIFRTTASLIILWAITKQLYRLNTIACCSFIKSPLDSII